MGWLGMRSLLDSIEAAKSTDAAAIVQALENWKIRRGDIDVGYRAFDHQMTNRLLVAGIHPKIADRWDYFDVKAELPATPADVEKAFGSQADTACKMDSL
jgi:branched-chain amino acid transport system substrate-binding protein